MTQSPEPARGVAQVGASAAAGPVPRRRPGRLGSLHIAQLALIEVVVIAVVALVNREPVVIAVAGVVGVVALVLALARYRGRWWFERGLLELRFRRRRRGAGAPADDGLGALRVLAPGLIVENVDAPDGAQVGVARDEAGWYAVALLSTAAEMRGDAAPAVPLDLLIEALSDTGQPGAVIQIVMQTTPAPSAVMDPAVPANESYRLLVRDSGAGAIPANRATWITVRLEGERVAGDGMLSGEDIARVPLLVVTLLRRVAKVLRRADLLYQVLDAAGLAAALARSCDLLPRPDGQPLAPREHWSTWESGEFHHRTFWMERWPSPDRAGALLTALTTTPWAASTTVAIPLAPDADDPDKVDLRCLIRVSATDRALERACTAVIGLCDSAGARLFPLDGEQGPAVYATAPTGSGAR